MCFSNICEFVKKFPSQKSRLLGSLSVQKLENPWSTRLQDKVLIGLSGILRSCSNHSKKKKKTLFCRKSRQQKIHRLLPKDPVAVEPKDSGKSERSRHMCFLLALQKCLIEMNEFLRRVASRQPTARLARQAQIVTSPSVAVGIIARFPPGWSESDLLRITTPSTKPTLEPLCTLTCFFFAPGGSLRSLLSKTLTDLIPSSRRGERPR